MDNQKKSVPFIQNVKKDLQMQNTQSEGVGMEEKLKRCSAYLNLNIFSKYLLILTESIILEGGRAVVLEHGQDDEVTGELLLLQQPADVGAISNTRKKGQQENI